MKGVNLDIIYSNIKHAFFQEAKNEVIVLLHLNLKNPIVIKNKKTVSMGEERAVRAAADCRDTKTVSPESRAASRRPMSNFTSK